MEVEAEAKKKVTVGLVVYVIVTSVNFNVSQIVGELGLPIKGYGLG